MGVPSAPASLSSQLSSQHERLILELLPFKDSIQFQEWLQGPFVRGSWHEYCREFLAANPMAPEPDKAKACAAAKETINNRTTKYLVYHPEKDNWTAMDHHVRFISTVIVDNTLNKLWSESDWKKRNLEICKAVYEVLSYLRGTSGGSSANPPPRYEG